MSSLDWNKFYSLPGSKSRNFENLCRALIRLHFGQYGKFTALRNQPGVEFHLGLLKNCSILGDPPRWYGWQCKLHELTSIGNLNAASRKDIENSLRKTEKYLPELTDWILWTPYTLSKKDQIWFNSLQTMLELHLWAEEEIDTYLSGPGLILRSTYFNNLILTSEELKQRHIEAIQPIRERWLEPVHQQVDVERIIRRMLGEPRSWDEMIALGDRLKKAADVIFGSQDVTLIQLEKIMPFVNACAAFSNTLLQFHEILADGDLDIIQQKLSERKLLIYKQISSTLSWLRTRNLPIALDATNAMDDMCIAQELLDEVEEFLGVGLVAVLADAGGGKTQMAAQLTAPRVDRPAGILLHGRDLHRGQTLDDLAHHFSINGTPLVSIEKLLAALDAAGKRAACRLPIVIDGLNEAENPKDWKASLSSLTETVKRYPNILVVCTLRTGEHRREHQGRVAQSQDNTRESFAIMALPDAVRRIESEGFGRDVDEAIKKYLNYFKINSGDAKIPIEFLQHPLNLRIFCEVTNPKHEREVKIGYFPASLSPLFEKYIYNACERISQMPNLSYPYTVAEVELAIYNFGLELWKAKKREVAEANYRAEVGDTTRLWSSSIVNLLVQEGIIFRNPGVQPGEYVITSVYDALGGYIIANSLLLKHASDRMLDWLKAPEVIALFLGDDNHELAFDIFISLVTLTPRRICGSQLWKQAPASLQNAALSFTTELEAEYLDKDTVSALSSFLKDSPKERLSLFSRLQRSRGSVDYPLNSEFLDSVLRTLSVSERDLSWTEWIRGTRPERFNDLLAIEFRWKENLTTRTPSDRLRAKWVMWLLTSTDNELRDVATRALYWYGRGEPEALFEESIKSLEINDPYIPERMLAASYGVAMARHLDLGNQSFVKKILPKYARYLYSLLFDKGASFSTTHLLLREYATRIVEIALLHNPELFTDDEIKRSKPPFTDGGIREWGESEISKEEIHGQDSPFRMDFENYTLGRLVPNRGNYDFKHEGYRKVRAQILWRIEKLGWSSEKFKDLDKSIANVQHWSRTDSDAKKVDRYGKKYSWIAYFEMSGLLYDQGVLEIDRDRTSSVEIDPSFPERVTKGCIIITDFLGDPTMKMKEWIANGPFPNVEPYLRLEKVQQMEGNWIMLDGFVVQEDETRGRRSFCFIRSFLISKQVSVPFLDQLSKQDLGGRWLPEKPDVIYTFAGEIPWCETFPENGQSEFSFLIKEEEYAKFNALIPVRDFAWEGYHTMASNAGHATTLAKQIIFSLDLIGQPQTFDLFTKDGLKATLNISDQSNDYNNKQSLFFIREDLLKTYLKKNDFNMIWAVWGERGYSSSQIDKLFHGVDRPEQTHAIFSFVKHY